MPYIGAFPQGCPRNGQKWPEVQFGEKRGKKGTRSFFAVFRKSGKVEFGEKRGKKGQPIFKKHEFELGKRLKGEEVFFRRFQEKWKSGIQGKTRKKATTHFQD